MPRQSSNATIAGIPFLGLEGAAAAALFLSKHPDAQIHPSSAYGISRTLEALVDKNVNEVHVLGVGLKCSLSEVLAPLAALRRRRVSLIWHCGYDYLDPFEKDLKKFVRCRFTGENENIVQTMSRYLWPRGTNQERVERIMQIGMNAAPKRNQTEIEEKRNLIHGAIWRFQNYRDYEVYPRAIRVLAGVEPMTASDRKMISAYRQAARQVLIGKSASIEKVQETINRCAPTECHVLIQGESGTGKEIAARLIHAESQRADADFSAINCATLEGSLLESELFGHEKAAFTGAAAARKGCFENADGGTIFLDEIGEMPLSTQAKVLRVIQEGRLRRLGGEKDIDIDVRILAATNRNLLQAVQKKQFRTDLYYRLAVITLSLPSLRERPEDIPLLAREILFQAGKGGTFLRQPQIQALQRHPWPGNVRELQNVLQRYMILGGADIASALDPAPKRPLDTESIQTLEDYSNAYVRAVYDKMGGNITHTAKALGISVNTVKKRL